jgi:hypothetical protein
MISDVLSDAVTDVDSYLNNKTYNQMYSGSLREAVVDLRNRMQALRIYLDTPPPVFESPEELSKFDAHWKKIFSTHEYAAIREVLGKVEGIGPTIQDVVAQLT